MRVSRTLRGGRLIAAVAFALLWPVAVVVPALVALMLVAIVWVGLHAYEIIWWREARAQTRALRVPAS
jgi:fatty acid desaturase